MRVWYLALLVIVASITTTGAGRTPSGIELSELQAVSTGGPPYIFRVSLTLQHHDPLRVPAVLVRRPSDVLALVKPNMLEIHLQTLTDVELEIRYDGHTLNRFFPTVELRAARARLQAHTMWERYQTAKNTDQASPGTASLLQKAHQAHQAWAQFDPTSARQASSRIEQAQRDLLSRGLSPVASRGPNTALGTAWPASLATTSTPERIRLEAEIQQIHEEIQRLVSDVSPWPQIAPALSPQERATRQVVGVALAGVGVAVMASLFTGLLVWRQACRRQREFAGLLSQPWRALPRKLMSCALPTLPPPSPSRFDADSPPSRLLAHPHLRVLLRAHRHLRLRTVPAPRGTEQRPDFPQRWRSRPASNHVTVLSAALLEALGKLRRDRFTR